MIAVDGLRRRAVRIDHALLRLGLVRRRELRVPTWRGWLLLTIAAALLATTLLLGAHDFLAIQAPLDAEILVVEGWIPDPCLRQALSLFERGDYGLLITVGGPLEHGSALSEHGTWAELAARSLVEMGAAADSVRTVPAPESPRNRTFAAAAALARWLSTSGLEIDSVDVVSVGVHARRSRLLFRKALGPGPRVGIIAADHPQYGAGDWWRSSLGFTSVTGQALAYLYVRLYFYYA